MGRNDDRYLLDLRSPLERKVGEAERQMFDSLARVVYADTSADDRVADFRRSVGLPAEPWPILKALDSWLPKEPTQ